MDWKYDSWPSGDPYDWGGAERGMSSWDNMDFHVDLGCGTVKKGRIGIDRFSAPGVNVVMDLDTLEVFGAAPAPGADAAPLHELPFDTYSEAPRRVFKRGLPFDDDSIKSVISHHCLEHIGAGFIALIDEVYRVLEPGGIFRAITPLFPSRTAVEDPDHVRYFMEGTWESFCGFPDNHWCESFSVPYTRARFELVDKDITPPVPVEEMWGPNDAREIRVALKARK